MPRETRTPTRRWLESAARTRIAELSEPNRRGTMTVKPAQLEYEYLLVVAKK